MNAASYEDAEAVWFEVQAAIAANADLKPEGAQTTSFFGNTAINYLFVAKQVPWLTYMSIATNIIVVLLVFAFSRDLRVTAVVAVLNGMMTTFWIGLLPVFGIGLAINLTLPLIFIYCIGSDYALHLSLRCKRTGDPRERLRKSVGKGSPLQLHHDIWKLHHSFHADQRPRGTPARKWRPRSRSPSRSWRHLFIVPLFYPLADKKVNAREHDRQDVPVVESRHVEVWTGDRRESKVIDAHE